MTAGTSRPPAVSRRTLLRGSAALVAGGALSTAAACTSDPPTASTTSTAAGGVDEAGFTPGSTAVAAVSSDAAPSWDSTATELFAELDAKIEAGMLANAVPGAAVGIFYQGQEYLKGYGVTSVASPQPVTPDTIFRIGSTTKTFTGTAVMRLVEAGKIDLDATVRTYLPDFATSDPAVADVVTIRMLLNHTPGWLGDDFQDFGRGADAVTQYAASIADLPMLTPPGSAFFYNNAAVALAGRVIEVVTGQEYEQAIQDLLLDPLRLDHTRFFTDDLVGYSTSAGHSVVDGKAQLETSFWYLPRSIAATGGLQSSIRDQLRYARFHLGHSSISGGPPILSAASLATMRSDPGPGGTLVVELDGMGVTWQLRPSAEGVRIVQHGGNWPGQHSGFLFVPERDFAITVLTNSLGGPRVISDLFFGDWALSRFAGLHNLPAETQTRTEAELAAYAGRFTVQGVDATGTTYTNPLMLTPVDGRLRYRILDENDDTPLDPQPGTTDSLAFYRDDFLLMIGADGNPAGGRCNFVRDPAGNVRWLLAGGRLFRKDPP